MIQTFLKDAHPGAQQMFLDPRTKAFLCITVALVTLASTSTGIMQYVEPCLAVVPLIFLMLMRKPVLSLYYAGVYAGSWSLLTFVIPSAPPQVSLMFSGLIAVCVQALPSMSMLTFLFVTTSVSELIAALDSLHVPKKFTVPISVMLRFFPTIGEEYTSIRDAMKLRAIGSWRNPLEMLEYRMVPLLTSLVTIGNELSASALVRGLNAPLTRTNLCPLGFRWPDAVSFFFCGIVLTLFVASLVLPL